MRPAVVNDRFSGCSSRREEKLNLNVSLYPVPNGVNSLSGRRQLSHRKISNSTDAPDGQRAARSLLFASGQIRSSSESMMSFAGGSAARRSTFPAASLIAICARNFSISSLMWAAASARASSLISVRER